MKSEANQRLFGMPEEEKNQRFYRRMYAIRRFEEMLLQLFEEGLLSGTTHACIGQEANCVGVIEHLRPGDHVFSNHRCHGHYLASTGNALALLAEIMGKQAGACAGIGGSQHIYAPGFKSNGILGGTVPAAAGIALAEKLRKTDNVSIVFIGDGAFGEGIIYETLNVASLWGLPLLVVVENNQWSQSTPINLNMAGEIAPRFQAFDIPVREVDSTDVLEIEAAAKEEIRLTRESCTPRALLIHTYRLCHHSKSDDSRPEEEINARWEIEPLIIHGPRLDEATRNAIEREVEHELRETVEHARRIR